MFTFLIFNGYFLLQSTVRASTSLSSSKQKDLMRYLIEGYLQSMYEDKVHAMEDSGIAEIMDAIIIAKYRI